MRSVIRLVIVLFVLCVATVAWAQTTAPTTAPTTQPARSLLEKLIWDGGPIVWFQLFVSVIGLAFAFERLVNLRRSVIVPNGLADRADGLWRAGKANEIEPLCETQPSTLARVIRAILQHRQDSPADVSTIAGDVASPELKLHLQKAYPVLVIATLEPLLGLFGTVYGMMRAFETVSVVGSLNDPSVLAKDISVALITTAVGLATAIPLLALYHFFKSRTNTFALELEAAAGGLIKNWLRSRAVMSMTPESEARP